MEKLVLKKLKPILETTFRKVKPYESENDYMESLQIMQSKIYQPWWDSPNSSIPYELIKARRYYNEVELLLKKIRHDSISKYAANDRNWVKLYERFASLRSYFIAQEAFLKENEEKRNRAQRKIHEETILFQERAEKLSETKKQYDLLWVVKLRMEERLKSYKIYEDFLNQVVVQSSGQFKSVLGVMSRYYSLVDNRETISKLRVNQFNDIDSIKKNLVELIEEKVLHLLSLNSKTVELISRYDVANNSVLHWETVVGEVRKIMEIKISEQESIFICIQNLFKQMCRKKNLNPKKLKPDLDFQLMFIKKTLYEIKKATHLAEKLNTSNVEKRKVKKVVAKKTKIRDTHQKEDTQPQRKISSENIDKRSMLVSIKTDGDNMELM